MSLAFELRYEMITLEAKFDYYIDVLKRARETAEIKGKSGSAETNIWIPTKEVLDIALVRMSIAKKAVEDGRRGAIPFSLAAAQRELESLRYQIEGKTCLPFIKKTINVAISDIIMSINSVRKKGEGFSI
ncbi:MAG: hypothetical protein QW039_06355 [Fervidicoccaceae archaeon]